MSWPARQGSRTRARLDMRGGLTTDAGMEARWMTTEEAAGAIGVRRQTVARWIREGRLPARRIQVGRRAIYRIDRRDLAAFVRRYVRDM
jgi:excisionase family DNA binding protein